MTRREFLGAGSLAFAGCAAQRMRSTRRPNILFALADDQSFPHAGALGDPIVATPAFDRVAAEGALFTRSFATCPSCTPSRSSILTGRHIWQLEQGGVLYGTLPAKYPILTHLLEDAGYFAGYTGKCWAPGDWRAGGLTRHPNGKEFNARTHEVPEGIDVRDYAANFDDFLAERPADQPFLFWFGCTEPHRVYGYGLGRQSGKRLEDVDVPPFLPDSEVVRTDLLDYYFEIEWFDRQLAKMLAKLEQIGELDNTIVVVTSDNGMPFPRAKVNLYDWGVRMPLAVRWGERISGGRRIEDFVSHIDLAPTLLEAAGVAPPETMTGRSLLSTLTSERSGQLEADRDRVYTGFERHTWCRPDGATYPVRAVRTADFLYLRNFEPDRWPTGGPDFVSSNKTFHGDVDACPTKTFMIEHAGEFPELYQLSFGKRPAEELYDVREDPGQIRNLAADPAYAEVKQRLWSELEAYLRQTNDPRIEGRDIWQDYVYYQTVGFGATFNRSLPAAEREAARRRGAHKPE